MLQTRLIGIMQRELSSQNLQLSFYCMQQMEMLVNQGVQRMRITNVVDHSGYVMQAERNLKFLIKYFIDCARDEGTFPTLTNSAFDKALLTCPTLWPYCSSS